MSWDLLIQNAKVFDGSGGEGKELDVAMRDGRIAALGRALPSESVATCVDAAGQWMTPGLLDIHTHEDLEVELDAGLPEVVRHGTTSVVVGNCSIGLAFGAQRTANQDPIVDCFARVENIPKTVLAKTADKATWTNPQDYMDHLDTLPLAANVAPFMPHSMLRIEVMGLADSVSRDPTPAELDQMVGILDESMADGYLGMSTDGLPLHFLANQPNIKKRIPTQYASYDEYKALTDVLRKHDRVWQMTPATDDLSSTLRLMMLTSGRLHGKPLKVTALAALDSVNNRRTKNQALLLANLLNSKAMNGRFRMQCLSAPFRVYSEGAVSPLAEANPLMRQLIETELEDVEARRKILSDPEYVDAFREMWAKGKSGFNLDHLLRKLRMESQFLTRDLNDMEIFRVPVKGWVGKTLAYAYQRYQLWLAQPQAIDEDEESRVFDAIGKHIRDDAEFFLSLLNHYDRELYWHYVSANKEPDVIKQLLLHPKLLPGFNDSGAHVTNMAYFDGNLRGLRIGLEDSEATFSHMVSRLTQEPAGFFGFKDVGKLEVGERADVVLLDPEALRQHDGEACVEYVYRDIFDCHQLVNRPKDVVQSVFVGGEAVWQEGQFTPSHGARQLGQALRVGTGA